jgi:hypothetical protein
MYKTLIVAHTPDFNTVTFLPSQEDNSAERPINSFHFIEPNAVINDEIKTLLKDEAGAESVTGITIKKQQQGVDYYLVRFSLKAEKNFKVAA